MWELSTERVTGRLKDDPSFAFDPTTVRGDATKVALEAIFATGKCYPRPGQVDVTLESDWIRIDIPSDVDALMAGDLQLAQAWRAATRDALTHYMGVGYEVHEFIRGSRIRQDICWPAVLEIASDEENDCLAVRERKESLKLTKLISHR